MRRSTDFPKVNLVQPILRAMCGTLGVRKVGSQADNKHFYLPDLVTHPRSLIT